MSKRKLSIGAVLFVAAHDALRFGMGGLLLVKLKHDGHEMFNGPAALASVRACLDDYARELSREDQD